jgi:hypothetical protein
MQHLLQMSPLKVPLGSLRLSSCKLPFLFTGLENYLANQFRCMQFYQGCKMTDFKSSNSKVSLLLERTDAETKKLVERLKEMRDKQLFKEGGFSSFEKFCDACLKEFGGYARVASLLKGEK